MYKIYRNNEIHDVRELIMDAHKETEKYNSENKKCKKCCKCKCNKVK